MRPFTSITLNTGMIAHKCQRLLRATAIIGSAGLAGAVIGLSLAATSNGVTPTASSVIHGISLAAKKNVAFTLETSKIDIASATHSDKFEGKALSTSNIPTLIDWVEAFSYLAKTAIKSNLDALYDSTTESSILEKTDGKLPLKPYIEPPPKTGDLYDTLLSYTNAANMYAQKIATNRHQSQLSELNLLSYARELRDFNAITGELERPVFVESALSNPQFFEITENSAYAKPGSACRVNVDDSQMTEIHIELIGTDGLFINKNLVKNIVIQHELSHCADPFMQVNRDSTNSNFASLMAKTLSNINKNSSDEAEVTTFLMKSHDSQRNDLHGQNMEKYADIYAWIMAARYGWSSSTGEHINEAQKAADYDNHLIKWINFRKDTTSSELSKHHTNLALQSLRRFDYEVLSKLTTQQTKELALNLSIYTTVYTLIKNNKDENIPPSLKQMAERTQRTSASPEYAISTIISQKTAIPLYHVNGTAHLLKDAYPATNTQLSAIRIK